MYWFPAILTIPYCILLLKIYRDLRKIRSFSVNKQPETPVSLIIACRNEEASLPLLLESLSTQDYPDDLLEIVIVDDGSEDNTFRIASEFESRFRLITLRNDGSGKKAAIRTGINKSSGKLLITSDADCIAGNQWISTIAVFFEANGADMIISPVQLEAKSGFFRRFQELEFMGLQGITAGTASSGNGIMCNGANLAFTREAYLRNTGKLRFDLNTGDDVFLLHSLKREAGSKIQWLESRQAIVTTRLSSTIGEYLSQRKRWLSKWNAYSDKFTILAGMVTFIATMVQLGAFISVFFNTSFIWHFLIILIIKSVPDYLILQNTAQRYGKKHLMHWFLPAQLIYPLYVLGVLLYSMVPVNEK